MPIKATNEATTKTKKTSSKAKLQQEVEAAPALQEEQKPAEKTKVKPSRASQKSKATPDVGEQRTQILEQVTNDPGALATLVENLSTETRRIRQFSAATLGELAQSNPELLVGHIHSLVDALHRPEAQTRWECLEILTRIVTEDPEACDDALLGAEASLYDEESGTARLAAMRFLSAYGAIDAKRSAKVWPYLDEGIQCYHGDTEFQDMLISVIGFASGRISKDVRGALASRMKFDAANGKGLLQKRALQIIELCEKK